MNKQNSLMLIIQLLFLSIPILLWKYISNDTIKFSMVLFVLIFSGFLFFRILEGYLQKSIRDESKDKYRWMGIIMQVFILVMFYIYSKRVLEMLN